MRNVEQATPTRLGLSETELQIVTSLLKQYVSDRPAWAFGSRTFGRARRRSDLDIAIGGTVPLPVSTRIDLAEAFDESELPIEVDLVDLNEVTPEFRKRIEPDFIALLPGHHGTAPMPELMHALG